MTGTDEGVEGGDWSRSAMWWSEVGGDRFTRTASSNDAPAKLAETGATGRLRSRPVPRPHKSRASGTGLRRRDQWTPETAENGTDSASCGSMVVSRVQAARRRCRAAAGWSAPSTNTPPATASRCRPTTIITIQPSTVMAKSPRTSKPRSGNSSASIRASRPSRRHRPTLRAMRRDEAVNTSRSTSSTNPTGSPARRGRSPAT